jgi:hypothetical protein
MWQDFGISGTTWGAARPARAAIVQFMSTVLSAGDEVVHLASGFFGELASTSETLSTTQYVVPQPTFQAVAVVAKDGEVRFFRRSSLVIRSN